MCPETNKSTGKGNIYIFYILTDHSSSTASNFVRKGRYDGQFSFFHG